MRKFGKKLFVICTVDCPYAGESFPFDPTFDTKNPES